MPVEDIRRQIPANRGELDRLGVTALRLFGSHARGEANEESDVDLIVEFDHSASFDDFMDVKLLLQDALRRPVDLVTPAAVMPLLRDRIEREAVRVA